MRKVDRVLPYTSSSFKVQQEQLQKHLSQIGVKLTDIEAERITCLSRRKYDRYDHFPPGENFTVRLIRWLTENFNRNERNDAFSIIKAIKFIDEYELKKLTTTTFENIRSEIGKENLNIQSKNWYSFIEIWNKRIEEELAKTIFVACADDINFDLFRRYAMRTHPNIFKKDNFVEYYKIDQSSLTDLPVNIRIVLLDQISASGTTAIRKDNKWTGKIPRFFDIWKDYLKDKKIYYCPYILSQVAHKNLEDRLLSWKKEEKISNEIKILQTCNISISPCISDSSGLNIDEKSNVAKLCKKYYNKFEEDEHTKMVGGVPYGYGRAGLTLVLQSNCPNNTLPILWHSFNDWYPLFPRVSHHR
jgi:hypothetical protein